MYWETRYKYFLQMVSNQKTGIINNFSQSWGSIDFSASEPSIIVEYKNKGIDYLNKSISPKLATRGFEMKFSSVFTHQTPMITRASSCANAKWTCEIGDLLVIFTFMDKNNKSLVNRAFLAQAKKEEEMDNLCQKCLYDKEKEFLWKYKNMTLNSKCCPSSPKRYFPKGSETRCNALKYLILDKNQGIPLIGSPWDSGMKKSTKKWGDALYQFLIGDEGFRFSRRPWKTCGWSAIMWDLICTTGKRALSKSLGPGVRGNYLEIIGNQFNDFKDKKNYYLKNEDGGISTIFIFVKDNEIIVH